MAQTMAAAGEPSPLHPKNSTFPFVRVPWFEVAASQYRELSGVEIITWNPLVQANQLSQWATYFQNELGWYNESTALVRSSSTHSAEHEHEDEKEEGSEHDDHEDEGSEFEENSTARDFIWHGDWNSGGTIVESAGPGPFAPIWHCSPPPYSVSFLNFDILSMNAVSQIKSSLNGSHNGQFSAVDLTIAVLPDTFSKEGSEEHEEFHHKYIIHTGMDEESPHSIFVQPVYEGLGSDSSSSSGKMVGFLMALVSWDLFVGNLLPDGVHGMTAILKNTCNQSYTYELDGSKVGSQVITPLTMVALASS
jgi:hypothetical protein